MYNMNVKSSLKMTVLAFIQASMEVMREYLSILKEEDMVVERSRSLISHYVIKENQYRSCSLNTAVEVTDDMSRSAEFLMSNISATWLPRELTPDFDRSTLNQFYDAFEDMHACISDIKRLASQHLSLHQRLTEVFVTSLSITESRNVSRLTIVAVGFLPLSLGSSLLSMSTRFADLGILIFDFVGVSLILVLVLFLGYLLVRLRGSLHFKATFRQFMLDRSRKTTSQSKRSSRLKYRLRIPKIMRYSWIAWQVLFVCYMLASFSVGMFNSSDIGLTMLWAGVVVFLSVPVVIIILSLTCSRIHWTYCASTQSDLEARAVEDTGRRRLGDRLASM
jgi:hypothetical protein